MKFNPFTIFDPTGKLDVGPEALGLFGDASDGAVVFDGTTDFAFATRVGTTYTLLREVHSTYLVVRPGVTVVTAGCRLFAVSTVQNDGTIHANGLDASGALTAQPKGVGAVQEGQAQNNPGTGAGAGAVAASGGGGQGGLGGNGGNPGGGQAAGPSPLAISLWRSLTGALPVGRGGPGSNGGGGGGGGGVVIVYSVEPMTGSDKISVAGGQGGAGAGTGTAGTAGQAGGFLNVVTV
jgi:hypothetical protein